MVSEHCSVDKNGRRRSRARRVSRVFAQRRVAQPSPAQLQALWSSLPLRVRTYLPYRELRTAQSPLALLHALPSLPPRTRIYCKFRAGTLRCALYACACAHAACAQPDKQPPPAIVTEHTNSLKGDAAESMEERFANIVAKSNDSKEVVFYKEIRLELMRAGMGNLLPAKIDEYVSKLYGLKPSKPSKLVDGKMVQDRGFHGLCLQAHGFDESAARIRRDESLRQSARHTTHDNFTSDNRIGSGKG